jgi:hypothetical protein
MPLPSPNPTPITSPTSQTVSGGQGYGTDISSIPPPSGTVSGLGIYDSSGPWYIVEQELDIDYFRVAAFSRTTIQRGDWALSGNCPISTIVSGLPSHISLASRIQGRVTASISYDNYQTSSYVQPQKFTVFAASADSNGKTYGDASSYIPGTFGPAGEVKTTQKFFSRVPYTAQSWQTEYSQKMDAYTYYASNQSASGWDPNTPHQSEYWGDMSKFVGYHWVRLPELNIGWLTEVKNNPLGGYINGGYSYAKESTANVINVLNQAGHSVLTGNAHDQSLATASNVSGWVQSAGTGYYCPKYVINRHDYS